MKSVATPCVSLFAFSPKAETKEVPLGDKRQLLKVFFQVQSKNLDVDTDRMSIKQTNK